MMMIVTHLAMVHHHHDIVYNNDITHSSSSVKITKGKVQNKTRKIFGRNHYVITITHHNSQSAFCIRIIMCNPTKAILSSQKTLLYLYFFFLKSNQNVLLCLPHRATSVLHLLEPRTATMRASSTTLEAMSTAAAAGVTLI